MSDTTENIIIFLAEEAAALEKWYLENTELGDLLPYLLRMDFIYIAPYARMLFHLRNNSNTAPRFE